MASYAQIAKKLQNAINRQSDSKLIINTKQWYSEDRKRVVTCYVIKQSKAPEPGEGKSKKTAAVELFKTYSTIRMLLFLRDYWYTLNGWEVPTDNIEWEEMKEEYGRGKEERR